MEGQRRIRPTSVDAGGSRNPASTISNLFVVPSGNANRGLALVGTRAEGVNVELPTADSLDIALTLSGGASFSRGVVSMEDEDAIGAALADNGSIADSSIGVPIGRAIFAAGSDVRRSPVARPF